MVSLAKCKNCLTYFLLDFISQLCLCLCVKSYVWYQMSVCRWVGLLSHITHILQFFFNLVALHRFSQFATNKAANVFFCFFFSDFVALAAFIYSGERQESGAERENGEDTQ